jgi:hypothetical protein
VSGEPGVAYVLPLRWAQGGDIEELAAYLRRIRGEVSETIVVDGSPPDVYRRHAAALAGVARHIPPDPALRGAMGKVAGVLTGARASRQPLVVIADDDVRYEPGALRRAVGLLSEADLVRPQNYFSELPWHARWDTARTLLNRVFTGDREFPVGDFPGTLAVRREMLVADGGYDGDALFENLELMRTVRSRGGTVATPLDLYVERRPPSSSHFASQRVRQAYDDLAMPLRLAFFLSLAPSLALSRRRGRALALACLVAVAVAEAGRRRAGGARLFPVSGSLLAPAWVAERAVCSWLAVGARLRGGVPYAGGRVRLAANPTRELRRRESRSPR